jgi:hypothetical protein
MAAFLPLMLLPGIVGKFMFVIPFVVTLAPGDQPDRSLLDAAGTHVDGLALKGRRRQAEGPGATASTAYCASYSRRRWRHAAPPALAGHRRRPDVGRRGGGHGDRHAVRVQFFAFDPMRLFYVNVDMPAGAPLEETLAEVPAPREPRCAKHIKPGEARNLRPMPASSSPTPSRSTATPTARSWSRCNPRNGGREVARWSRACAPRSSAHARLRRAASASP